MVAEQLLHLQPATLLLMLLNKLFEVKHMVTSNVIRVHMHIWRRTEALSLLIAIMVTCTSVIYSCFYGVQDLQYTFVRPTATYRRMVSYTYWSGSYLVLCGHEKWFVDERKRSVEAADSRHRRFELQQSNSKNVMGWASRWCNQPFLFCAPLNHDIWRYSTLWKQRSVIDAAISAPNPPVIGASWLTCYSIFRGNINNNYYPNDKRWI